ncbi:MAG: hypothetical protein AAB383_06500 [Patescibacteria group bacterium]
MADASTPAMTPAPASSGPKDWLAFATYFFPLVLIYTMIKKGSEPAYVWHSKNAAGAIVISILLQIISRILWAALAMSLLSMILSLVLLALFILMIYGGLQAANGKQPTLPVVTQIGQKIPLEKWFKGSAATPAASASAASPAPMATPAPTMETPAPAPAPMPEPAPMAAPAPAPMPEPMPAPTPAPEAPATPAEPTPPTPPAPTTQA